MTRLFGKNVGALVLVMVIGLWGAADGVARSSADGNTPPFFADVQSRLVSDGFDPEVVDRLYARPGVGFETGGVSQFFRHSEARLDYGQFLRQGRIRMARQYLMEHSGALAAAEDAYGVPRSVITAIMLVETQLGTLVGNQTVFNILSTMAALDNPGVREMFWKALPTERRLSRKAFEQKADRKSSWAYAELKALLRYGEAQQLDPVSIRGSYAGAMGYCQFMPSNALRLGVDANGDERVDLFDHTDAIASVGNYLQHHGWRPGLTRQQQYRVILKYNYSRPYAETILEIADRLMEG